MNEQRVEQLYKAREQLAEAGVKHKGRAVPFGITDQLIELPDETIDQLRNAGNVTGNFLAAVNKLMTGMAHSDLRGEIPELGVLNRTPTAAINAIAPDLVPSMFRLDLIMRPEGGFEASEIELLFGGIGYTEVMRNIQHRTNPARSLGVGFARMLNYLSEGRNERCSVVTLDWAVLTHYIHDINLFAQSVRQQYPNYDLVYADKLRLDRNGNLVSNDNPEPIRYVHRFFEIYMGVNGDVPNFDLLLEVYKRGTARDLPSLKQFLEEKLIMSLPWMDKLRSYFEQELGAEGLEAIKRMIPHTQMLTDETVVEWQGTKVPVSTKRAQRELIQELSPLLVDGQISKVDAIRFAQQTTLLASSLRGSIIASIQNSPRLIRGDELVIMLSKGALTLSRLPKDKRDFVVKKSGFSEGAAEAKSVVLLNGMPMDKAEEAVNAALASPDVYVVQTATPHRRFQVEGLFPRYKDYRDASDTVPESLEVAQFNGFARIESHYFQTGPRTWEIGDISATVTPDKKTHGRTDALITFAKF